MTFRTYHEVRGEDRSGLLDQVNAQRRRVRERLREVRRVVAVMSGKGGVGKSYLAAGLAVAIAPTVQKGVGLLDADLAGPTAAHLLGARGPLRVAADAVEPAIGLAGVKVVSTDLLLEDGRPLAWRQPEHERFVWRSALEAGALREFLADVAWGALDILLVDLPPGHDRLDDLVELVPDLAGAIAVTIPSEESRRAVRRAMRAARDAGIPLLGVIENMRGYSCDGCAATRPLFEGDAGASLAAEFDVPLLGALPFVPRAVTACAGLAPEMVDRVLGAIG